MRVNFTGYDGGKMRGRMEMIMSSSDLLGS